MKHGAGDNYRSEMPWESRTLGHHASCNQEGPLEKDEADPN